MTKVEAGNEFLSKYFSGEKPGVNISKKDGEYLVPLVGAAVRDAAPRDTEFEWLLDIGRSNIDRIFEGKDLIMHEQDRLLHFVFPERWMSCVEQRYFVVAMCRHPQAREIKGVYIVTSSPIIIGEIYGPLLVVTSPERKNHARELQGKPAVKDCWSKQGGA